MFRFMVASILLSSVLGDHHVPHHSEPAPYHVPSPSYKPTHYDESPQPYAFKYGVSDDYSGAQFTAEENADGKITSGSYQVALPDGRIQTVTYTVDGYNGFVADVAYEGTPSYPKYEPKHAHNPAPYQAPAPSYKPAPYHAPPPTYKPAPSYKPTPTPAYKPAPSYEPTPIPSYKA